jgi:hypothetical protein
MCDLYSITTNQGAILALFSRGLRRCFFFLVGTTRDESVALAATPIRH